MAISALSQHDGDRKSEKAKDDQLRNTNLKPGTDPVFTLSLWPPAPRGNGFRPTNRVADGREHLRTAAYRPQRYQPRLAHHDKNQSHWWGCTRQRSDAADSQRQSHLRIDITRIGAQRRERHADETYSVPQRKLSREQLRTD
jgi:hypothetical protein